jgi:hypothetical protein
VIAAHTAIEHPDTEAATGESAAPERAVIQIAGLTATVECYAWEDDPDQRGRKRLWALGLVGPRQGLEAIWANLIQGREAVIAPRLLGGGRFCALAPLGAGIWKSQVVALNEASGAHRILRPVVAHYLDTRPDFVLLPRRAEDAPTLHYRFLDRRVALPLAPAWADWLWTRALATGEARRLDCHSTAGVIGAAYRCEPDLAALEQALSLAVRAGELPAPG